MNYDWSCKVHGEAVCPCNLRAGSLERRNGILCTVDDAGRFHLRAPRRTDAAVAQRVGEAVRHAENLAKQAMLASGDS